jgi:hypothetical protein
MRSCNELFSGVLNACGDFGSCTFLADYKHDQSIVKVTRSDLPKQQMPRAFLASAVR